VVLGEGTLAASVMTAAGLTNLATELGYTAMMPLPLEQLVSHEPDIVIVSEPMADAPALADQIAHHPALRALEASRIGAFVPRGAWACGGPFVIEAVRALTELREEIAAMNGGKSPMVEKLRSEKAALEQQLRVARDERAKQLSLLISFQHIKENIA